MENRVHVDIDQVVEVLVIAGGHGIDRLIRIGHGIEKGIQRALDQLHKGILDRIPIRPAENRVLDNMGDARRVGRGRPEADVEDLVVIVILQQNQSRAGLLMAQEQPF